MPFPLFTELNEEILSSIYLEILLREMARICPNIKTYMTLTLFEHATFWTGARRATIATESRYINHKRRNCQTAFAQTLTQRLS